MPLDKVCWCAPQKVRLHIPVPTHPALQLANSSLRELMKEQTQASLYRGFLGLSTARGKREALQTLGMADVVQRIAFSLDARRLLTGGFVR